MLTHTFKPNHSTPERQRQAALYKFKANLLYIEFQASVRPCLKNKVFWRAPGRTADYKQ